MPYYIPSNDTVFIHIPKTAGSSVSNWIRENLEYTFVGRQHDRLSDWLKCRVMPSYHFVVVRNPYSRIFSWFHYQGRLLTDQVEAGKELSSNDQVLLEYYYKGFTHWMTDPSRPWYYKDVKRQQVDYFDAESAIVVHLENLNHEFVKIQDHFNCYAPIGIDNASRSSELDYREHYNNKSRAIVEKIYSRDLSVLGYNFNQL